MTAFYQLTVGNTNYSIHSFSLSGDIDSVFYTWSAELKNYADYVALNPLSGFLNCTFSMILVPYDLGDFELIIENASRSDSGSSKSYTISGRSKNALLDSRYNKKITRSYSKRMASVIVSEMCALWSIPLTWGVVDWQVEYYEATSVYPIDIIKAIVEDVGMIQPTHDGGLTVIPRNKQKPTALTAPDHTFTDGIILPTVSESYIDRAGYDFVSVGNETIGTNNPNASMEWVAETRTIKVYVNPWQSVKLNHSMPSDNLTLHYDGVVIESITDEITFNDGKANLSKPFYSQLSVTWKQNNLGTVTANDAGELVTAVGMGLADVTYNTRYHKYTASPKNGIMRALVWAE
jgi:hypothetical protein